MCGYMNVYTSLVPRILPPSAIISRMTFAGSCGSKVIREIITRKEGGAWERG